MAEIIDRRVSFNAGELSPWLDARIDLDKYRMGCRQLQNMRPAIYGGAMRRAGTVFMGAAKTSSTAVRLVPFVVNSSTFYVLEFSNLLLRVWNASTGVLVGAPLEVVTPYTTAQLNALQFVQQNDILYVAHPSHAPRKVIRTSATEFDLVLVEFTWPATFEENITDIQITVAGIAPGGATAWSGASVSYAVGAVVTFLGRYNTCKVAHVSSSTRSPLDLNNTYWQQSTFAGGLSATVWNSSTTYNVRDRVTVLFTEYVCLVPNTNKTPDGDANPLYWCRSSMSNTLALYSDGQTVQLTSSAALFEAGHVGTQWLISKRREVLSISLLIYSATESAVTNSIYVLGEWTATVSSRDVGSGAWGVNLLIERSFDMFSWETHYPIQANRNDVQSLVSGNEEVPVFLRIRFVSWNGTGTLPTYMIAELEVGNPLQTGVVQISEYTSSTVVKGMVKLQIPTTLPTTRWNKPAFSSVDGYPRAMTIHEGRLFFGGTASQPTHVWGSAVDTYGDFRVAAAADRSVAYTLASDESSCVEWLVSQDMLVMGTTSSEWVFGQRPGEDVPKLRKNSSFGSASVQARIANDSVVYLQRSTRKLREYAYSVEKDGYASNDLTMLAEHLGDAVMIQMAIARNPESVIYVITSRGDLLAITYERGQSVAGWCRYVTDGAFESVAVVSGGEEDHVWVSVKRTIGGVDKRYVERFAPDLARAEKTGSATGMILVDAAKVRTGAATTTITGLSHLEGKTVKVLGDGVPQADKVVASGQITISSASNVIVGLPYTSILEPTFLETPDPSSMTKAGKKRLTRVVGEYWKSNGISISGDGGVTFTPVTFDVTPTFPATAGSLFTGLKEHYVDASSDRQASIILKTAGALPLNVMSLTMRYQVEMS